MLRDGACIKKRVHGEKHARYAKYLRLNAYLHYDKCYSFSLHRHFISSKGKYFCSWPIAPPGVE